MNKFSDAPDTIFRIFAPIVSNVAFVAVVTPFSVIALATTVLPSLTDFFRSAETLLN